MTGPDDDLVKGDSFVKVDCGILDSSLYERSARDQRSVFLTSLFMAKPFELSAPMPQLDVREIKPTGWNVPPGWYGIVRASAVGIIQRDGIDKEPGYQALDALGSPDPDSRSQAFEGRRMVRVDGGYVILNYFTYRDREYTSAERMRRLRGRRQAEKDLFNDGDVTGERHIASPGVTNVTLVTEAESIGIEQRAETDTTKDKSDVGVGLVPSEKANGVRPLPAILGKRNIESIRDRLIAVTEEIQAGTRKRLARDQIRKLQAETLFAYWQAKFNKPRAWLDDKRERIIVKRLEENKGDISELFFVLDGALKDDWVTGKATNANHPNDGIEYIFRDRARVEQFANLCRKYRDGETHGMAKRYGAILSDADAATNGNAAATAKLPASENRGNHDGSHGTTGSE